MLSFHLYILGRLNVAQVRIFFLNGMIVVETHMLAVL